MNKDSAVPKRESLPDGKNADAASYMARIPRAVKIRCRPHFRGNQHGQHQARFRRHHPAARARRTRRSQQRERQGIHPQEWSTSPMRARRTASCTSQGRPAPHLDDRVDGRELPQLKRDLDYPDDEDSSSPPAMSRLPSSPTTCPKTHPPVNLGRDEGRIRPDRLGDLDAETNDRESTLQADRIAGGGQAEGEGSPRRELGGAQGRQARLSRTHFSGARYRREPRRERGTAPRDGQPAPQCSGRRTTDR